MNSVIYGMSIELSLWILWLYLSENEIISNNL